MRARSNGECNCGNPQVTEGQTKVRYDRGIVVACDMCDQTLADEPDEADPNALHSIRVRILVQRYAKPDGSYFIYVVELDGAQSDGPEEARLPDGTKKAFGLCGPVGHHERGDIVRVTGKFTSHARYGFQMEATSAAQLAIKESHAGLVAFLSRFPNIGRTRAEALLGELGGMDGVIDALEHEPNRLCRCSGITEERALEIKEAYDREAGFREFRLFASRLGIGEGLIAAAIEKWGDEAQAVIEENPFELMELPRCGFKTADAVHHKLGLDPKKPSRCAAGVEVALGFSTDEGHIYTTDDEIFGVGRGRAGDEIRRLNLSREEVEVGLKLLETEYQRMRRGRVIIIPQKVIRESGRVYLKCLYDSEWKVAQNLRRLSTANLRPIPVPTSVWGINSPAPEQEDALKFALECPILILTGGPGTGKTHTTNAILNALEASGMSLALCAPTGKAAKRMSELTGRKASTIHKLVATKETSSDALSIDADVLCVDESSMIDSDLFARLLECIKTGSRLVIVGDVDQLPSIGAGRVLYDLIESGLYPVVRLTKIFRQKSDGISKRIPEVARTINLGELPNLSIKGTDVTYISFDDVDLLQQKVVKAVSEELPKKLGCRPEDIQVISPQKGEEGKKGWPIGVRSLNMALQNELNPRMDSKELHIGEGYIARTNDRIIHRKNNYDLGVMNGELGQIVRLETRTFIAPLDVVTSYRVRRAREVAKSDDKKKRGRPDSGVMLIVDYGDGRRIGYSRDEIREIQLAYALTCHLCQGSEYQAVVMVVHSSHSFMLTRALCYTALTRAKNYVLIIGQSSQLERAVRNQRGVERRTTLRERLESTNTD